MIVNEKEQYAIDLLVKKGTILLNSPPDQIAFTGNPEIDSCINDPGNYAHFFVLACVLDRQMKTEKVWEIPYLVSKAIGGTDFDSFSKKSLKEFEAIFHENNLHPFSGIMAAYFYKAVQKIRFDYWGDASRIWREPVSCNTVLERLLEFEGMCVSTAAMALKLLAMEFRIPLSDKSCIDISPGVPVRRVFTRLGFIEKKSTKEDIISRAREMNPDCPAIFDFPVREIERQWCRPNNPDCSGCYLNDFCLKKNLNVPNLSYSITK